MTTVLGYVIGHVDLNKALHSHVTFHEVTWDLIKASGAVTCVGLRAGGFKANFKMTSRGKSRDNRPRLHHRSCGTEQGSTESRDFPRRHVGHGKCFRASHMACQLAGILKEGLQLASRRGVTWFHVIITCNSLCRDHTG